MKFKTFKIMNLMVMLAVALVLSTTHTAALPNIAKWAGSASINGEAANGLSVVPYDTKTNMPVAGYNNPSYDTVPASGLFAVDVFANQDTFVFFMINGMVADQEPVRWSQGGFSIINITATDADRDGFSSGYPGYTGKNIDCDDTNSQILNVGLRDLDSDGARDCVDLDDDGDGLSDQIDQVIGTCSDVSSNIFGLNCLIENEQSPTNTAGEKNVKLNNQNISIEFQYNFSNNKIDWGNITINFTTNESTNSSSLSIRGVILEDGKTKNITLPRRLGSKDSFCIKDSENAQISEITSACTASDETAISCPGQKGQYTCLIANQNTSFIIMGLSHSAISQQTYCGDGAVNAAGEQCDGGASCTASCTLIAQTTTATGRLSGGGSSSGGAGLSFRCTEKWQCTEWESCINSIQERECTFEKVSEYIQSTTCPKEENAPEQARTCNSGVPSEAQLHETSIQMSKVEVRDLQNSNPIFFFGNRNESGNQITGAAIGFGNVSVSQISMVLFAVVLLLSVTIFYRVKRNKAK